MKKALVTITLATFAFFPCLAQAAQLYFGTNNTEVGLNQSFEVGFFLDSQGEEINALEGSLQVDTNFFEIKEIRDGNSTVNLWIEKPGVSHTGEVLYSGIIPSGYTGKDIYLFSLILQSKNQEGKTLLKTQDSKVLLNDGLGTETTVTTAPLELAIDSNIEIRDFVAPLDNELPEVFLPQISRDESLFDNKWFVVFDTKDKISGIDRYELVESIFKYGEKKLLTKKLAWQHVESPHVLNDQKLRSYIYIKAVDNAGNERYVTLYPQKPIAWYTYFVICSIILGSLFIVVFGIKKLKK